MFITQNEQAPGMWVQFHRASLEEMLVQVESAMFHVWGDGGINTGADRKEFAIALADIRMLLQYLTPGPKHKNGIFLTEYKKLTGEEYTP